MRELIEVKKMPLRYILKNSIRKATEILLEIARIVCFDGNDEETEQLGPLSDKLYSEIPFIDSNNLSFEICLIFKTRDIAG